MCNIFVGADPQLWDSKSKSVRIDGFVTSIRMENAFWIALEEIAYRDQMSVNQLIQTLYHESVEAGHDMTNFTSFLRVCALRYHSLIAVGRSLARARCADLPWRSLGHSRQGGHPPDRIRTREGRQSQLAQQATTTKPALRAGFVVFRYSQLFCI